jgi:hypothetical protein
MEPPPAAPEPERLLRAAFATTANQLTQMYLSGLANLRSAQTDSSRKTLDRVAEWVKQHATDGNVSQVALLAFVSAECARLDSESTTVATASSTSEPTCSFGRMTQDLNRSLSAASVGSPAPVQNTLPASVLPAGSRPVTPAPAQADSLPTASEHKRPLESIFTATVGMDVGLLDSPHTRAFFLPKKPRQQPLVAAATANP